MMEIRLRTELHVITAFGYEASEVGMMAYRQTVGALGQRSNPADMTPIVRLDQQIWGQMIQRTFGLDTIEPIDIGACRQIVHLVTSKIQQDTFLNDITEGIQALGPSATDLDKNTHLQTKIYGIWLDVLPKFGYEGDDGYVRFQAGLVAHSSDPEITTLINSALKTVVPRSGDNQAN
eukprot:FR736492.1.p1 GENE.FR736492.1~~FR736492.1.p1  ORF type:complete len:177 (+),score=12.05 FR736492.1:288-818(+)